MMQTATINPSNNTTLRHTRKKNKQKKGRKTTGKQGRKGMESKEGEERRGRAEELQRMGETERKQEWNGGSRAGEEGRKEGRRREEQ